MSKPTSPGRLGQGLGARSMFGLPPVSVRQVNHSGRAVGDDVDPTEVLVTDLLEHLLVVEGENELAGGLALGVSS